MHNYYIQWTLTSQKATILLLQKVLGRRDFISSHSHSQFSLQFENTTIIEEVYINQVCHAVDGRASGSSSSGSSQRGRHLMAAASECMPARSSMAQWEVYLSRYVGESADFDALTEEKIWSVLNEHFADVPVTARSAVRAMGERIVADFNGPDSSLNASHHASVAAATSASHAPSTTASTAASTVLAAAPATTAGTAASAAGMHSAKLRGTPGPAATASATTTNRYTAAHSQ